MIYNMSVQVGDLDDLQQERTGWDLDDLQQERTGWGS